MKNTSNKLSVKVHRSSGSHFYNHKISIEDYEGIRYPNLDTKRAVIDKLLADKINELFRIIDAMEQKII